MFACQFKAVIKGCYAGLQGVTDDWAMDYQAKILDDQLIIDLVKARKTTSGDQMAELIMQVFE